jgi:PAS domain S-box-containing protein
MTELTRTRASARPELRAARRDGERYFRRLLEALPAAAFTCDAQGLVTFYNQRAPELWGRKPTLKDPNERFGGALRVYSPDGTVVPPERSWVARALHEHRDFFGEPVEIERPDGSRIRALVHASPIRSEDGSVIGGVNVLVDVTEITHVQETLRESERRFRLLAESLPSFTWTADADGSIRYISDRWFRYTGLETGLASDQWPEGTIHPEDLAAAASAWRLANETGGEHRAETRLRGHDGTYRWFEARAIPLKDSSGNVLQWFGATTDIDDRKRAEEIAAFMSRASDELARLSDYRASLKRIAGYAIPAFADWCGIFLCDASGEVQRLTLAHHDPEMVRFLHAMRDRYPYRAEDPIGPAKVMRTGEACWSDHMPEEMLASFAHDEHHLAMLRRVNFRSWVCVPIHLEGRIGGAISFVLSDSGRRYDASHLRMAEDLARRVSMAIENQELVAALRESDARKGELLVVLREEQRRKDEFITMLADELRNPLAPIQNALQQLPSASALASSGQRQAREVVDREMRQLARLVQDLHDVARIGRGTIELRRDRVQLGAAINAAVESCRMLMERSRHQMTVSMPVEPIHVDADLARLAQVFSNLIANAVKYTELGGQIWITADREGDEAVVRVRDNGPGIPADMLETIFEPFTRSDQTSGQGLGGLGIGLTLARRLVQMHGGSLVALSEGAGKGAEFVARLPAQ